MFFICKISLRADPYIFLGLFISFLGYAPEGRNQMVGGEQYLASSLCGGAQRLLRYDAFLLRYSRPIIELSAGWKSGCLDVVCYVPIWPAYSLFVFDVDSFVWRL